MAVENLCCNIWIYRGRGVELWDLRSSSVMIRTSPLRCFSAFEREIMCCLRKIFILRRGNMYLLNENRTAPIGAFIRCYWDLDDYSYIRVLYICMS